MRKQTNLRIYFLLLLPPLFWGGAFGAAKHVITEVPPITSATLRFGAAGLILLGIVLFRGELNRENLKRLKERWSGIFFMALTGIFAYNMFFFIALKFTSAINGSLIMATTPVFLTIGAVFIFHERWNKRLAFGLSLSLFGVVLVIMRGSLETLFSLTFNAGDLLFVAGLLSWVSHGLIGKAVMKGLSPLLTTTITTLAGSILLGMASMVEKGWNQVPDMSLQSWIEMIYMILFASVCGFFLWNFGIQKIGASKSGIYMNLVPINAAWMAVWFYGASISWVQIVGMGLVIAGVYITTIQRTMRTTPLPSLQESKAPNSH